MLLLPYWYSWFNFSLFKDFQICSGIFSLPCSLYDAVGAHTWLQRQALSANRRSATPLGGRWACDVTRDLISQWKMRSHLLGEFLFCASFKVFPKVTDFLLFLVLLALISVFIYKMAQKLAWNILQCRKINIRHF